MRAAADHALKLECSAAEKLVGNAKGIPHRLAMQMASLSLVA